MISGLSVIFSWLYGIHTKGRKQTIGWDFPCSMVSAEDIEIYREKIVDGIPVVWEEQAYSGFFLHTFWFIAGAWNREIPGVPSKLWWWKKSKREADAISIDVSKFLKYSSPQKLNWLDLDWVTESKRVSWRAWEKDCMWCRWLPDKTSKNIQCPLICHAGVQSPQKFSWSFLSHRMWDNVFALL